MYVVHISSAILITLGFVELLLTLRFLLFQCDSRTTPIYKGACITWLPLGVFIVMDAIMMAIVFRSYGSPVGETTVKLFLFLHQATMVLKSVLVLFLGSVILWRLAVFYGKQSRAFLVHLALFFAFLGAYWTGAFITVFQISNLKRPVVFAVLSFGIRSPTDIPPDAPGKIMRAIKVIFAIFQTAFVLETILIVSGTLLFLFAIGNGVERSKFATIKVFIMSQEGCRLMIITCLSIIKIVLFSLCEHVAYISMLVFFFSSLQYPLELHLFLQTSYHTSRYLLKSHDEKVTSVEYGASSLFKPQYTLNASVMEPESTMNWSAKSPYNSPRY
jgi:hypothetical protein